VSQHRALADASVDPTDARKATVRRFGRSDRRAQGDRSTLRSICSGVTRSERVWTSFDVEIDEFWRNLQPRSRRKATRHKAKRQSRLAAAGQVV
jgi:hypothetical protein